MSDSLLSNGDHGDLQPTPANQQLATPALSPISEHGDRNTQPFPSFDADGSTEEQTLKTKGSKDGGTLDLQTNGIEDHNGRHSGVSSPKTAKLSPTQLYDLVQSPESLPIKALHDAIQDVPLSNGTTSNTDIGLGVNGTAKSTDSAAETSDQYTSAASPLLLPEVGSITATPGAAATARPAKATRSASSPLIHRKQSSSRTSKAKAPPTPLKLDDVAGPPSGSLKILTSKEAQASPMPNLIPVPPLSFPTYLQLELSSDRPSALYIHRSVSNDFPYESAKVKFERLLNFLLLPPILEQVLWFGAIACLDAWLYTFTILPLRFLKAVAILGRWVGQNIAREVHDLGTFVYSGVGRVWQRRRQSSVASSRRPSLVGSDHSRRPSLADVTVESTPRLNGHAFPAVSERKRNPTSARHRRTRSTPSLLLPNHKADILQGLLIVASCTVLMWFDASRMYHSIRGQAAIKLYVIYNVLEVFDRLFSALGQDVLECLFSKETLERNENGRSKILRPLWMFMLALAYNVIHSAALFYQVVTLNVAVNSYSNALLTLLMSNQFVEIKGTVFKKFEKENLFQLTCADVVERFQLWLMLLIIALRNIVEVGGLSMSLNGAFSNAASSTDNMNATGIPLTSGFIIPKAFTLMPKWTGELLGPFLIVLGSEALVDWCKHAYISKFNNVKSNIYGRFLDVLAKDYYSHAFADQNLTKRLGLPVLPLSCLFIRACIQTYHMFLATHMPLPMPSSATSISVESDAAAHSPSTTAALQHVDHIFRRALGRSTFGVGSESTSSFFSWWSLDDIIAFTTMAIFFLALYLVLLALKLVLGMALLSFARTRYKGMKEREHEVVDTQGKRVGGWGVVEVNEDKRRWIYEDDPDALRELREREERGRKKAEKGEVKLDAVKRYGMVAKRIW
ncbi:hypothetical protein LTR09_011262 [Extremus antarcticus]|uniref:DUF747-domain-containing protein n=1 Tax=Extremus antarcticus TaxID=702011 RepID=A0AAJ0D6J5_9PEZI|nr:hypothetical protein LTR09_011262 [Extremus antarcticus]